MLCRVTVLPFAIFFYLVVINFEYGHPLPGKRPVMVITDEMGTLNYLYRLLGPFY